MNAFFHLSLNELRRLLYSPTTYLALVITLSMMGFFYFLTLVAVSSQPQGQAPQTLFISLFWIPVLLIVPMLTMRSFAEDRRLGTIETVLTTYVSPTAFVLAKFVAAYVFYMVAWGIALCFPWITATITADNNIRTALFEEGPLIGGYLFIAISGTFFISIGIFTSSLTRSQLVAGMLSFSLLFMMIVGVASLQFLDLGIGMKLYLSDSVLSYFQIFGHFEDFSRGLVDSRPIVYYLSGTAAILGLSVLVLDAKN